MFSYLRPHRRIPSTPTSPLPDHTNPAEAPLHHTTDQRGSRTRDVNIPQQRLQNTSASPPVLPPISRVASYGPDDPADPQDEELQREGRQGRGGGGRSYMPITQPWIQDQRPGSAGNAVNSGPTRPMDSQPPRPQTGIASNHSSKDRPGREPFKFVTITDIEPPNAPPAKRPPPPLPTQTIMSTFGPSQPRSSKTRLNLLNPMSLLARRRTSQGAVFPTPPPLAPKGAEGDSTDGYDPRIRGTKVHDFSAPRPKRNISYGDKQGLQNADKVSHQSTSSDGPGDSALRVPAQKDINRWSGGKHSPAFTEDFDEEQYPAAGPHVRKTTDFTDLHAPQPAFAKGTSRQRGQPPTTTSVYPELGESTSMQSATNPTPAFPETSPQTRLVGVAPPLENSNESMDITQDLPATAAKRHRSSVSTKTRSRNASQNSKRDSKGHFPKHMKSTSSRFSFDMIGAASEEKLLEDRHRKKALEKKGSGPESRDDYENEGEDDFDYDNILEDDELEERIPGVNADAEEYGDDETVAAANPGISGFTFHSMNISPASTPLSTYSPGIVGTPRDANGEVIGFAITKESPYLPMHHTFQYEVSPVSPVSPVESSPTIPSRRIMIPDHDLELDEAKGEQNEGQVPVSSVPQEAIPAFASPPTTTMDDDDLYFDDGIIEHPSDIEETPDFDESVFDNDDTDEYGRPLRPLSSLPTLYSPPSVRPDAILPDQGSLEGLPESRTSQAPQEPDPQSATSVYSNDDALNNSTQEPNQAGHDDTLKPTQSLTQDTLSAYQSALAEAAYNAVANGRFRRNSNPVLCFDERDEQPSVANDNNELSTRRPLSPSYEEAFVYDDTLGDDAIIAEANAEALANDHDNFYGQEFGFYTAPAPGEAQYGGFFDHRGAAGSSTTQNGRVVSREPNLTPITERSEYSNRNSVMSLPLSAVGHIGGGGQGNLNSPGLAQLAGMLNEHDPEDLSLDALLKLRRGAWGGSQASLRSSNGGGGPGVGNASPLSAGGRGDGSPILQHAILFPGQLAGLGAGHSRGGSSSAHGTGLAEGGPDAKPASLATDNQDSVPASPTLTMDVNLPAKQQPSSSLNTSYIVSPPVPTIIDPRTPAHPTALISSLNSRPLSPTTNRSSAVGMVSPPSDLPSSPEREKAHSTFGSISSTASSTIAGPNKTGKKGKHRHSASSDSISYMKEDDPVGGERWVLERRRTAESGEVEILGREIVRGGRI